MSVSSKMTAIADKIRALLGIGSAMGLDAMAINLTTEQTNISEAFSAVESKGGTVPVSQISGNLAAAINSIPEGVTVQRKSGSFTTNRYGEATVNCGFKPDYVVISNPRTDTHGYNMSATAHFAYDPNNYGIFALLVPERSDDVYANSFDVEPTNSGFWVLAENIDYSFRYSNATNVAFNYYAVKYE